MVCPINHMAVRQLNRICLETAKRASITKKVSMHTLRHSNVTWHSRLSTTALYAQVATNLLRKVISLLDALKRRIRQKIRTSHEY